jgi:hypothetical protein
MICRQCCRLCGTNGIAYQGRKFITLHHINPPFGHLPNHINHLDPASQTFSGQLFSGYGNKTSFHGEKTLSLRSQ